MGKHLNLEERGKPERFLGMNVEWMQEEARISGAAAITKLAEDHSISRSAASALEGSIEPTNLKTFQVLTGRLLFITRMWRPDMR